MDGEFVSIILNYILGTCDDIYLSTEGVHPVGGVSFTRRITVRYTFNIGVHRNNVSGEIGSVSGGSSLKYRRVKYYLRMWGETVLSLIFGMVSISV